MHERIRDFIKRFGTDIELDCDLIVKKRGRYFLISESLRKMIINDFFYAGVYLGKSEKNKFLPSFDLLRMIALKEANKTIVDKKTEWLFICGRDIFQKGIVKILGSKRKNDYTLIVNKHNECLGFGRMLCDLDIGVRSLRNEDVAVENMLDLGDFLRREKFSEFRSTKSSTRRSRKKAS
jgi:ribosome biogenesis protein Nip4